MPKYDINGFQYSTPKELTDDELGGLAQKLEASGALHPNARQQEIGGREELKINPEVMNSYKTYYKRTNGKDFSGSNDELVDGYMEQMRYWNTNMGSIATLGAKLKGNVFSEEERQSIATMWDAWDRTVPWYKQSDGKWQAMGDFAEAAITDPANWAGLLSGGTATAASVATNGVARTGIRQLLKQYAVAGAKSGAISNAMWSGASSVAEQNVRTDIGLQEGVDGLKVLADTALGAGAGAALGGALGLGQGALKGKALKKAGEAAPTAAPTATPEVAGATPEAAAKAPISEPFSLVSATDRANQDLAASVKLAEQFSDPTVVLQQRKAARESFLTDLSEGTRNQMTDTYTNIGQKVSYEEAKKRGGELLDRLGVEDYSNMGDIVTKLESAMQSGKLGVSDISTYTATVNHTHNKAFTELVEAATNNSPEFLAKGELFNKLSGLRVGLSGEVARGTAYQKSSAFRDFADMNPLDKAEVLALAAKSPDASSAGTFMGMMSDYTKKYGRTAIGAANELFVHNVLGSPQTIATNVLGGGIRLFTDPMKRIGAGALHGNVNWIKSGAREYVEQGTNLMQSGLYGLKSFYHSKNFLDSGRNFADADPQVFIGDKDLPIRQMFSNGVMNGFGNTVRFVGGRTMKATDEFIKQISFRSRSVSLALDDILAKNPEMPFGKALEQAKVLSKQALDDQLAAAAQGKPVENFLAKRALEEARDVTFQNEFSNDVVGKVGNTISDWRNSHPILTQFMPFIRTPIQIIEWSVAYTPVLQTMADPLMGKIRQGGKAAAEAEAQVHLSTLLTASALVGVLAMDVEGDGPSDRSKAAVRRGMGVDRNSVELPETTVGGVSLLDKGTRVGLNKFDPISRHIGMASKIKDIYKWGTTDDQNALFGALTLAFANNLGEMSSMAGVKQFIDAWESDKALTRYAGDKGGSFIPYFRLMAEIDGEGYKKAETILEGMSKNIPGINKRIDFGRDPIFGAIREKADVLLYPLTPIPMRKNVGQDDVDKEILRLGMGMSPPDFNLAGGRINLKKIKLDSNEGRSAYDRMQELVGLVKIDDKQLYDSLRDLINNPSYNEELSDPEVGSGFQEDGGKAQRIKRVVNAYRKAALTYLIEKEMPDDFKKEYQQSLMDDKAAPSVKARQIIEDLRAQ